MNDTNNKTPSNLRPREASEYLRVGLSTIWLYAKQGKITPIKLSARVTLFEKADLDRFIANQLTA